MKRTAAIINRWVRNRFLQHVLFWALSYYLLLRIFAGPEEYPPVDIIYTALFHLTLFVGVYPNLEVLIPRYLQRERYWQYFILLLLIILAGVYFNIFFFENLVDYILPGYYFISYYEFVDILQFFLAYIVITSLIKLSRGWFMVLEKEKEIARISEEKKTAELMALKAQVNPHFLFNNLNNIYGNALRSDKRTPEMILQLSDVLRYMIYEVDKEKVDLDKELGCIRNYLELERMRSDELLVDFNVAGETEDREIAPLLLIPFIENAFKHGAREDGFVRAMLSVEATLLTLEVENRILENMDSVGTGIGISNVRRRLELQYPGRHQLGIMEKEGIYRVELKIEL